MRTQREGNRGSGEESSRSAYLLCGQNTCVRVCTPQQDANLLADVPQLRYQLLPRAAGSSARRAGFKVSNPALKQDQGLACIATRLVGGGLSRPTAPRVVHLAVPEDVDCEGLVQPRFVHKVADELNFVDVKVKLQRGDVNTAPMRAGAGAGVSNAATQQRSAWRSPST